MAFDSTRIVAQINLKGSLPEGRFSDQELLDFAYDSLLSEIVPAVIEAREEYFVASEDYPVTASQADYLVPARALNGVLREVKLVRGTRVVDLERIDLEDVTDTTDGSPNSFYISSNSICLYPTPSATQDTLRLYYFMRPSKLVATTECAVITGVDVAAKTVTVTIPTGWTTANTFDLVRGRAHYDIQDWDLTATSVAGGSITFTDALPSALQVGDYVTLAEETCFPYLPPEGHVALVQSAVTSALESMGDPSAAVSAQKTESLTTKFKNVLETRIQGAPKALGTRLL